MTYKLVLLRHGQSEWNEKNLFTGWVDVNLTDKGRAEAKRGGELLAERNILPDVVHTSLQRRAINTANLALDAADRLWIPVKRTWRLNERHYGALQGKNKSEIREEYGDEKFMTWRRSYDVPPPPLDDNDPYSQANDPRYADVENAPRTECLKDVLGRMLPYWESDIKPDLAAGKTVLVAAHGNSLRSLVKHLEGISDEDIAGLNIPTGIPLYYELDENFKRPFFSISITDFWHRWHITLGTWMTDYVFYPVTLSKWMGKFGKWGKKVFGKKTGRTLPICLANLIVFFVVGVWHGAAWKYIVYGMYNGIIIAFSGLMAEHYRNWKKKFNITGKENWYHVFMIIRTFILVNISWFFDRADTVGQAFHMMKLSVTKFAPSQLLLIPAGKEGTAFTPYALAILAAGCIILFIVSVLQERGMKIRESLAGLSLPITVAIYFCLLASIGFFGSTAVARGFIYAQF